MKSKLWSVIKQAAKLTWTILNAVWYAFCQLTGLAIVTAISIIVYAKFMIDTRNDIDNDEFTYSDVVRHVEYYMLLHREIIHRMLCFKPPVFTDESFERMFDDSDDYDDLSDLERELLKVEEELVVVGGSRPDGTPVEKPF